MAVTLGKLKNKLAEVKIELGEDTLSVQYNPNLLTPNAEAARVARIKTGELFFTVLCEELPKVVVKWDLMEDDEKTAKSITAEMLGDLGQNLILAIWNGINKDTSPGK